MFATLFSTCALALNSDCIVRQFFPSLTDEARELAQLDSFLRQGTGVSTWQKGARMLVHVLVDFKIFLQQTKTDNTLGLIQGMNLTLPRKACNSLALRAQGFTNFEFWVLGYFPVLRCPVRVLAHALSALQPPRNSKHHLIG